MRALSGLRWFILPGKEACTVLAGPGVRVPLIASAIGMGIGFFLILFTIQTVSSLSSLLRKEFGSTVGDYLVISRKTSLLGTLASLDQRFTPEEVAELRKQPFVSAVGVITMSRFRARLTGTESIPFTTELFFESVPDRFLGVIPEEWTWHVGDDTIPLLISRDFLDLYNYGFAVAYRLPQLTPHTVQNLRLSMELGGERFTARIAGFSERYNSILVPEAFIAWANDRFASAANEAPARVVLHVERPEHRQLAAFLEQKGYETNREKLKNSRLWNLLIILGSFAGVGGAIITILAVLVTAISFQLSMSRHNYEIRLLMHLGIPLYSIIRLYLLKASLLILGSWVSGLLTAWICFSQLAETVVRFGYALAGGLSLLTVVGGCFLCFASVLCHAFIVRRHVLSLV